MKKGYRIGVIASHLDGEYFGRLLTSIHSIIRRRESQLFAIQVADDYLGITSLEEPVAFHLVDAWILILPSTSPEFLDQLFQCGKPVVCLGFQSPHPKASSVLVHNRAGMKEAVLHLIDHGHRRIAYIGSMIQYDLQERLLGYREALEERGLAFDDTLVFPAADNLMVSGADAARRLLDSGATFTAVAAGTDLTAVAVIETLRANGRSVPHDVAVVGFDDSEIADSHEPPLTTVRQSFDALSQAACRILFDRLDGHQPNIAEEVLVPTQFMQRQSCGCSETLELSPNEIRSLRTNLSYMRSSIHMVTVNSMRFTDGLIKATEQDSVQISNLYWNNYHWVCLALWETDDTGRRHLVVRQAFSSKGDPVPPIGEAYGLEQFPPVEYLPPSASHGGQDITILHPVRTQLHDWGFVAVAGPFDPVNHLGGDMTVQSFTILAVGLEREMLFSRIRAINEKLQIVSRTTTDGIWDWDLTSNRIEWNISAQKLFSRAGETLSDNPLRLMKLIHPEDKWIVDRAFTPPFAEGKPIMLEFRIRSSDAGDMWLFGAAEVIRDAEGKPARIIGSLADITQKKENEASILQLAYHDALTGLPNRTKLQDSLQKALERAVRKGGCLAVLMIDLDRFKLINDTLGHQAGDKLLCQVSERLKAVVGNRGIIARLGGDEFIVLLHQLRGREEAAELAEQLLTELGHPFQLEGRELFLAASIGISLYPEHGADSDTLIKHADLAMYHAKDNGGNSLELYKPSLSSRNDARLTLETGLRRALERNEFTLYFQPQISLSSGKVFGAEALLRWDTPDGRRVTPSEFIPLAEETALIIPIGRWVMEQACLECKRWLNQGYTSLVVSVNISALQLRSDQFPDVVRQVLRDTGVEARHLCLEITEYAAVQNVEHSIRILQELADIGVTFAIDDFGTGQSQFVALKKFPAHAVKIDPSFIREMMEQPDDEAIVQAVITMAHSLGLSVTAEGVETEGQLQKLCQMQCDYIQGYYTGRPMTSEQFLDYLLNAMGTVGETAS